MIALRPAGIRSRLALALFVAALLAFAAAGGAILLFERFTFEDRARGVVEPYAELVSVGAEAAVAFLEPHVATTPRPEPRIPSAS